MTSAAARERQCAIRRWLSAVGIVVCLGCGTRADLATVTGKITIDGQPLPDAFVVFAPTASGTSSRGKTDAGGNYEMMFSDREKGAWIGENIVRIYTGDVGEGAPKERVPAVYNKQSTLKADVKAGTNAFNFDLKTSAGKIEAAPVE